MISGVPVSGLCVHNRVCVWGGGGGEWGWGGKCHGEASSSIKNVTDFFSCVIVEVGLFRSCGEYSHTLFGHLHGLLGGVKYLIRAGFVFKQRSKLSSVKRTLPPRPFYVRGEKITPPVPVSNLYTKSLSVPR